MLSRLMQLATHVVPTLTVNQYSYWMDGQHTGELFLMKDELGQVAWRSKVSNLTTPWHGKWIIEEGEIWIRFDYTGRDNTQKWAMLNGENGVDYLGRRIHAVLKHTWRLDSNGAGFLLGS